MGVSDHVRFCFFIVILITYNHYVTVGSQTLEKISDDDLVNLIKSEKYVVTLFTKQDCPACDDWEQKLVRIREELVDDLSAWVVKVVNGHMTKLYDPSKEPAVVFFRHGVPLLYDGPKTEDDILNFFTDNKEPIVKELTDDTFEHLTQASSGATTGDWFVMFCSTDSVECQRMSARWETVGAKLKQRINVAKVNKYTTGASTARRFSVYDVPEFIFFRQGKMYRYQIPKTEVGAFVSFAQQWYKNARSEKVPVPQSPFDDLTQMIADVLRGNPWIMKLGSICICVMVIVTTASKFLRKSEASSKSESSKSEASSSQQKKDK